VFTTTIANKIIVQLKELTKTPVSLFNEKGIFLASSEKKIDLTSVNDMEKHPLFYFNYHFGFLSFNDTEDAQFFPLVKAFIEMFYGQQLLLKEESFSNKTIESFIESIEENSLNSEEIKKLEQRLGLLFSPPYQIAIGQIDHDKTYVLQLITNIFKDTSVLTHFFSNNRFCFISFTNSSTYFQSKLKELNNQLHSISVPYQIGVSQEIISYNLLHKAWKEAMDAFLYSSNDLVFYNEILLESLILSSNKTKREEFMRNILKDLTEKYDETIENFCKYNLNIADCSKAMFIHRNSLIYRLKKINEITGLDPMKANDVFLLKIALKIKKIDFQ